MTTLMNADMEAYWFKEKTMGECYLNQSDLALYINPHLDEDFLAVAIRDQHKLWLSLHPQLGVEYGITPDVSPEEVAALRRSLADRWHGADQFFYFNQAALTALQNQHIPSHIRRLSNKDGDVFDVFCQAANEADLEGASVELDHWLVYGLFEGEQLVAAASMYPWDEAGQPIADLGVLTLSEHRGKGHARELVTAICQRAWAEGYQPQYRCQLDNTASLALAKSLKLIPYVQWDVVVNPDAE